MNVATSDTTADYFLSTSSKKKSQYNFQGDKSLVKEANIFLTVALHAYLRNVRPTVSVWQTFFEKGSFAFDVTVPETVRVDEDMLSSITTGPSFEIFNTTNALDVAGAWDRSFQGRRTYLVGENKIVPGGRAIEFQTKWEESGGNGLSAAADLRVIFAGGEYEPSR